MKSAWKNEPVVVLDACALIAFFNDEPGAELVAAVLQEVPSVEIAAVNLLEIAYDAIRRTGDSQSARDILRAARELPLRIHWGLNDVTLQHAAEFKARFRISLADAIALALAEALGAPVATCDHHEFDPIEDRRAARFLWIR